MPATPEYHPSFYGVSEQIAEVNRHLSKYGLQLAVLINNKTMQLHNAVLSPLAGFFPKRS